MAENTYDAIAEWYDQSIRAGLLINDLVFPALLTLMGDIRRQAVCDLACGQGVLSRQLAMRGAKVTGVDLSARLLEIAQRDEQQDTLGITYIRDDAQTLAQLKNASFDGVLCNMSLMDIEDLPATYRSVARILRKQGWFAFSITHPCFQTPLSSWSTGGSQKLYRCVSGYFSERHWFSDNPNGVRGRVGAYHRTLSTYINALADAGLVIEHMLEPRATGPVAERVSGFREIPAALIVKCRKQTGR